MQTMDLLVGDVKLIFHSFHHRAESALLSSLLSAIEYV